MMHFLCVKYVIVFLQAMYRPGTVPHEQRESTKYSTEAAHLMFCKRRCRGSSSCANERFVRYSVLTP